MTTRDEAYEAMMQALRFFIEDTERAAPPQHGPYEEGEYPALDKGQEALALAERAKKPAHAPEDESNKPPMPAHDYAKQWAMDTLSGKAHGGRFHWGERNLAKCYLDELKNRTAVRNAALKEAALKFPFVRDAIAIRALKTDEESAAP